MAYETRVWNNPEMTGYIVREKVLCGKKNCRCFTKGEKHTAFYLYHRQYEFDGTRKPKVKLKKKYLKKIEVASWQKKISSHKGMFFIQKLNFSQIAHFCNKYPYLEGEKLYAKVYELLGKSKYASQWASL